MFVGNWENSKQYNRGDIVYVGVNNYFACCVPHVSLEECAPAEDDNYYWLHLDNYFLDNFATDPSKGYLHYSGVLFQDDAFIKNMLDENSSLPLQDISASLRGRKLIPPPVLIPEETLEAKRLQRTLKRKVRSAEQSIDRHKRQKTSNEACSLRESLLLLNVDVATKAFVVDKYENIRKASGSEYTKGIAWMNTVSSIPFGRYKPTRVTHKDTTNKIKEFFGEVKEKLDKNILGLEDIKQEIMEYVARKITNPHSKGHVLALCGPPGLGKTKIIKSLSEAMSLPFFQINCGGLNDATLLTGHSETYVGAKPGKIVEILQSSNYMNPIIYLDEIDKVSENRANEINGVLTHLLDEEQNAKFQDNYLSNVPLNLSRVFFVLAFNDISKVDRVVLDRLKVIHIEKPSVQAKVDICTEKVVPEIMENIGFRETVLMDRELVEYIITRKCEPENGVRHLKKTIEKILSRLNYDIITGNRENLCLEKSDDEQPIHVVTTTYVDKVLGETESSSSDSYLHMYT